MLIGLISDTHGRLRPEVFDRLAGVDLILHAGDIGSADILVELEAIAPVHAVTGNTDGPELFQTVPEVIRLDLQGHRIAVVHGHRLGSPTPERLRAQFPDADIIVYGHTHKQRIDHLDGCLIVNPGAAGPARFRLEPAVALLRLEDGVAPTVEHRSLAP